MGQAFKNAPKTLLHFIAEVRRHHGPWLAAAWSLAELGVPVAEAGQVAALCSQLAAGGSTSGTALCAPLQTQQQQLSSARSVFSSAQPPALLLLRVLCARRRAQGSPSSARATLARSGEPRAPAQRVVWASSQHSNADPGEVEDTQPSHAAHQRRWLRGDGRAGRGWMLASPVLQEQGASCP